ncbi:MAG: ankyrin repeat domain-containing protein [Acidobacteriota bacterium]
MILTLVAACSFNPNESRSELRQRGIAWNEQAFLEHAKKGDREVLTLFLEGGMDPDTRDEKGVTALMYSALSGHPEAASLLVEKGAKLNLEDQQGRTALDYASVEPGNGVFAVLISKGATYGSLAK